MDDADVLSLRRIGEEVPHRVDDRRLDDVLDFSTTASGTLEDLARHGREAAPELVTITGFRDH